MELTAGTEVVIAFGCRCADQFQTTITSHDRVTGGGGLPGQQCRGTSFASRSVDPTRTGMERRVEVQKTLTPLDGAPFDFLPLGSQGPYIGLTTGLGVIQDIGLRAGGSVGLARRRGRPYHVSASVSGGCSRSGLYDSRAAIPSAAASVLSRSENSRAGGYDREDLRASGQRTLPVTPIPERVITASIAHAACNILLSRTAEWRAREIMSGQCSVGTNVMKLLEGFSGSARRFRLRDARGIPLCTRARAKCFRSSKRRWLIARGCREKCLRCVFAL